jgi:hypothetical protein
MGLTEALVVGAGSRTLRSCTQVHLRQRTEFLVDVAVGVVSRTVGGNCMGLEKVRRPVGPEVSSASNKLVSRSASDTEIASE